MRKKKPATRVTHNWFSYSPIETHVALVHLDFHPDYRVFSSNR